MGRTAYDTINGMILISSASGVTYDFEGDSSVITFKNLTPPGNYGYAVIELDSMYYGRFKIIDILKQNISLHPIHLSIVHHVKIFKATEAQNGDISILNITADKISSQQNQNKTKIEFIGNSITCGMGNDTTAIPCGKGQWYDEHNAYYSYASITARVLHAEAELSSVSGIGIYRNWNSDSPVMPDVYENLHLDTNDSLKWDFSSYIPDIVTICLGTNDFSDGDHEHDRKPFDSTMFIQRYRELIKTIYSHYPATQILLLTSPMLSGDKRNALNSHLHTIANEVMNNMPDKKKINIFQFNTMTPGGCSYHPSKEDHQMMADQLIPFIQSFIH